MTNQQTEPAADLVASGSKMVPAAKPETEEALARRISALADEFHAEELRILARDFRAARAASGKTMLEVSRLIGVSPATVLRIERGDQCDLRTYLAARNWLDNQALASAVQR